MRLRPVKRMQPPDFAEVQKDPKRSGPELLSTQQLLRYNFIWGFPKIWGTLLGFPIIRIVIFWGLHWVLLCRETTVELYFYMLRALGLGSHAEFGSGLYCSETVEV